MRMNTLLGRREVLLLLALLTMQGLHEAVAQTDFAGVWNNVQLSTPAQLTLVNETNYPSYTATPVVRVVNIYEKDNFEVGTMSLTVDANGNFTGPASGKVTLVGPGKVQAVSTGNSPVNFSLNAAQDVMVSVKKSSENSWHDLELLLKAPATLARSDLAGTWKLVTFGTPRSLQFLWATNTTDPTHPVRGITEVEGRYEFASGTGTMTVASDGSFSLVFGAQLMLGTATPGANGSLAVSIPMPPEPAMNLTFYVNQSKDVMATVHLETNYQEMIVAVKLPASQSVDSMQGLWRDESLATPAQLTLNKMDGMLVGIPEAHSFSIHQEQIYAGKNGVMTAPLDQSTGTFAVLSPGTVQVSGTSAVGEAWTQVLACNAGGNFMIANSLTDQNELMLVVRAPSEEFSYEVSQGVFLMKGEYGLISGAGKTVYWAPASDRELVRSTDLENWSVVPSTAGQSQFKPDLSGGGNYFYQVRRVNP